MSILLTQLKSYGFIQKATMLKYTKMMRRGVTIRLFPHIMIEGRT